MRRESAAWIIVIGCVLTVFGVVMYSTLESQPFEQWALRVSLSEFALLIGVAVAIVGTIMWAAKQVSKTLVTFGGIILACSLLGFLTTPLNFHNWTITLGLVYSAAFLIGVIFMVVGMVKAA